MPNGSYAIWCIEPDGSRQLVRDDLTDKRHADQLVAHGNHGAEVRKMGHRYLVEPVAGQPLPGDVLEA